MFSNLCSNITEVTCGIPPNGTNTLAVLSANFVYQQTYTYTCNIGYNTKESLTTQCLANRSWSLIEGPNCTGE